MKVQLKRLTLDFACCYILSIHFSAKHAGSKNCVLQTPDFFVSSRLRKTLQQIELEKSVAFHFSALQAQAYIISLRFFLILKSVLAINKIGLLCRDSCREKSVYERKKSHEMPVIGWWHLYFSVASELNNQCNNTTSCFQIFSFPYSDLHF